MFIPLYLECEIVLQSRIDNLEDVYLETTLGLLK